MRHQHHELLDAPRRAPRRRSRYPSVALLFGALVVAMVAGPAGAADPPDGPVGAPPAPGPPASADDVLHALRLADIGVTRSRDTAARAERELRSAQAAQRRVQVVHDTAASLEASATSIVTATRTALDEATDAVRAQRFQLRRMARETYVHSGDRTLEEIRVLLSGGTVDGLAQSRLVSGEVIKQESDELQRRREQVPLRRAALDDARAAEQSAADGLASTTRRMRTARSRVTKRTRALETAQRAVLAASSEQQNQRNRLSLAAALPPQEVPMTVTLLGQQRLSAEDLAGWFISSGYTAKAKAPITDLATFFIEEGAAEGIRGDIAFAQAILETGGFRNRDTINLNNYSGIGHCNDCQSGWLFPSPREGVRAQIQLLKSYALKHPTYRYPLVDRRLHGPAGCCQTWQQLSTVWASGPEYGLRIMEIYARIVDFALTRRTGILQAAGLPVVMPPAPAVPPPPPPPIEPVTIPPKLVPPPPKAPSPATTTTRPSTPTTRRPTSTTTTTRPATTTTTSTTTTTTRP